MTDLLDELQRTADAGGVLSTPTSRGTATIRFGTSDITDEAGSAPVATVCRYTKERDGEAWPRSCGHQHRSRKAAWKCARSMAQGWSSGAVAQWVRIEVLEPTR